MLKKLFKHEWIAVTKILLLIHAALLIFAVFGRIMLIVNPLMQLSTQNYSPTIVVSVIYLLLYILGVMLIAFCTYLFLAGRFYKNLFTDEGYLMNTLPVTADEHIWSKFFVFAIWTVIDLLAILLSLCILFLSPAFIPNIKVFMGELWKTFSSFYELNNPFHIIYLILSLIIALMFDIFMVYFSIAIGSLWKTHKVIGSIVSFSIMYIVIQMMSIITMVLFGWNVLSTSKIDSGSSAHLTPGIMIFSLLVNIVFCMGFYFGTRYIMTRKLNLS